MACKVRVHEEAVDARVLSEEQLPVEPLEIEGEIECVTHPDVLKQRTAQVEHETLHAGAVMLAKFALDQFAVVEALADIAAHPVTRDVFDQHIVFAALNASSRATPSE